MPAYDEIDVQMQLASFGQSFTFRPIGGPQRTVAGIFERRRTVQQPSEHTLDRVRYARVLVLRDRGNLIFGGIDDPQLQDELQLAGENTVYRFNGEVIDENDYAWKLEFVSGENERMGSAVERK